MEPAEDGLTLIWAVAGLASFLMITSLLVICAEFKRKHKVNLNSEPVQLIYKQQNTDYSEPNVSLRLPNGHIAGPLDQRANSPTWRNSSLSRELPAIPDVLDGTGGARGDARYESASNLYACLDDVRVTVQERWLDPQSSDSSRDTAFPVVQQLSRVHPYDRIGGPTASTSAGLSGAAEPVASTSHAHAQILQQMDNDQVYRGARSDRSYTSVTVRAPLSDLLIRRMSEDGGYTKLTGDENHLYAQVGGEYGGSVGSEQLGSAHIYNELYAEIDALSNGPAHYSSLINPYATSASLQINGGDGAGPSHAPSGPPLTEEERDKLYAKVKKPSRGQKKNSFVDTPLNGGDQSAGGRSLQSTDTVGGAAGGAGHSLRNLDRTKSEKNLRDSVDAAINSMDTSVSSFVSGGLKRNATPTTAEGVQWNSGSGSYLRREHVYEMVPDS